MTNESSIDQSYSYGDVSTGSAVATGSRGTIAKNYWSTHGPLDPVAIAPGTDTLATRSLSRYLGMRVKLSALSHRDQNGSINVARKPRITQQSRQAVSRRAAGRGTTDRSSSHQAQVSL